jgi:hypothetical protein
MAKVLTKKRIALTVIGCIVLAFGAFWGAFSYSSVCTTCGAEQHATDWQLPMLPVTYWRTRSVSETPLSRAMARDGLVGPHQHTWAFARGGGNGVMCAIGPGRHVNVNAPDVVAFLDAVTQYRGVDEGRRWAAMFLLPKPGGPASYVTIDEPREGFPTKEGFEMWWEEHREEIDWALSHTATAATDR